MAPVLLHFTRFYSILHNFCAFLDIFSLVLSSLWKKFQRFNFFHMKRINRIIYSSNIIAQWYYKLQYIPFERKLSFKRIMLSNTLALTNYSVHFSRQKKWFLALSVNRAIFDAFDQYFINLFACALSFNYLKAVNRNSTKMCSAKCFWCYLAGVGFFQRWLFFPSSNSSLSLPLSL